MSDSESPRCSRLARASWLIGLLSLLGNLAVMFTTKFWGSFLLGEPGDPRWLLLLAVPCLAAVVVGLVALSSRRVRSGELRGLGNAIEGIVLGCFTLFFPLYLLPVVLFFHQRWSTGQEANNLREIGKAMRAYADAHHATLPAADAFRTRDGRPGLSWRVALLPYLGEDELYKQFNLDEPWDGPNNIRLLSQMPMLYRRPGKWKDDSGLTHYHVFVGPGTAFERSVPVKMSEIPDGPSTTLLVVPAKKSVLWTKPDDLEYAPDKPLPALADTPGIRAGRYLLTADGSVTFFGKETPETTIRAMITRNGGEKVTFP